MNTRSHRTVAATLIALTALVAAPAQADFTLAAPFANGMVVQRDAPVRVWGTAEPGGYVVATMVGLKKWGEPGEVDPFAAPFVEAQAGATVDDDGNFVLEFEALPDAGHFEVYLSIGQEQIILEDVLVGEVVAVIGGEAGEAMTEGVQGLRVLALTEEGGAWDDADDGTDAMPPVNTQLLSDLMGDAPVALVHAPSADDLIGPGGGLTVGTLLIEGDVPEAWEPANEPDVVNP